MRRELPTIKICNVDFIVDIRNQEFREAESPANRIPFSKVFLRPDEVAINYDRFTRNVYDGSWISFLYADHTESVHLPPLIELDREGVWEATNSVELHDDAELLTRKQEQDAYKAELLKRPKLEIEGTLFFYERIGSLFRQADNAFNLIQTCQLLRIDRGLSLLYDPRTKKPFSGTTQEYEQRNDLRLVEIPSLDLMNEDTTGKVFTAISRPALPLSRKQFHQRVSYSGISNFR